MWTIQTWIQVLVIPISLSGCIMPEYENRLVSLEKEVESLKKQQKQPESIEQQHQRLSQDSVSVRLATDLIETRQRLAELERCGIRLPENQCHLIWDENGQPHDSPSKSH